ncbi:MAG: MBL fold metallo-hydrolase, partial [Flavobacterium sp.]
DRLILIDTGVGLRDCDLAQSRLTPELIDAVGFRLDANSTAVEQIRRKGLDPSHVTDIILSHLDCDHIGGIIDFPNARVHLSKAEYDNYLSANPRYVRTLLPEDSELVMYADYTELWNGLKVIKLDIAEVKVYLTPLYGHTLGHCGVVYYAQQQWWLYVGDAYYLREELTNPNHPIHQLTSARADDNDLRIASLEVIKRFVVTHPDVNVYGYHDPEEIK